MSENEAKTPEEQYWEGIVGKGMSPALGRALSLALQTKILERVPQVLEEIQKHPDTIGLTHAKILAGALKIEQERTEEATRIGQKRVVAMRDEAIKAFDAICISMWGKDLANPTNANLDDARNAFLEKLGFAPEPAKL